MGGSAASLLATCKLPRPQIAALPQGGSAQAGQRGTVVVAQVQALQPAQCQGFVGEGQQGGFAPVPTTTIESVPGTWRTYTLATMTAQSRGSIYAHLISVGDAPATPREFPLTREANLSVIIGRSPDDAVLVVEDDQVSRRHAVVACNGNDFVLSDLGSRNGTYVNNEKLSGPRVLKHGDVIELRKLNRAFKFDVVKITKPWIGVLVREEATGIYRVGQSEVRLSTLERQLLNALYEQAGQ